MIASSPGRLSHHEMAGNTVGPDGEVAGQMFPGPAKVPALQGSLPGAELGFGPEQLAWNIEGQGDDSD